MTPEQELAQALGLLPTTAQEKLASSLGELSTETLEAILVKEAGLKVPVKKAEMEKLSADEKIALADSWGREMAREHHAAIVKEAALPPGIGNFASKAMGVGKKMLQSPMGQKAVGAGKAALKSPHAGAAIAGAGVGAAGGMLKKPEAGGSRIGGALRGAALGGAAGAGGSVFGKQIAGKLQSV
jgi:hypothetical protein